MASIKIYETYLVKMRYLLETENLDELDYTLKLCYSSETPKEVTDEIEEILKAISTYLESRQAQDRLMALWYIIEYEKDTK